MPVIHFRGLTSSLGLLSQCARFFDLYYTPFLDRSRSIKAVPQCSQNFNSKDRALFLLLGCVPQQNDTNEKNYTRYDALFDELWPN